MEAADIAAVGNIVQASSTDVRQPPQPESVLLRSIRPVPRMIVPGSTNFMTVTSSPTGHSTCGTQPMPDSSWFRSWKGTCGLSKPARRIGEVQWAPRNIVHGLRRRVLHEAGTAQQLRREQLRYARQPIAFARAHSPSSNNRDQAIRLATAAASACPAKRAGVTRSSPCAGKQADGTARSTCWIKLPVVPRSPGTNAKGRRRWVGRLAGRRPLAL